MKCLQPGVGLGMRMKMGRVCRWGWVEFFREARFSWWSSRLFLGIGSLELIPTQTPGSTSRNLLNQSNQSLLGLWHIEVPCDS